MSGHFGPGVIGQEQYEAEQAIIETAADIFGPGVLDDHPANKAKAAAAAPPPPEGAGDTPADDGINSLAALAAAVNEQPADQAPAFNTLSVGQLTAELAANPSIEAFDKLMRLELDRPEGPRKGAARAFLAAEKARPEPRAEVLAVLTEWLTQGAS